MGDDVDLMHLATDLAIFHFSIVLRQMETESVRPNSQTPWCRLMLWHEGMLVKAVLC